jgi:hypothetical protein
MKARLATLVLTTLFALAFAGSVQGATNVIRWDRDGAGVEFGTVDVKSFGWETGNALSVQGNQAVANFLAGAGDTTFALYYQTRLVNVVDSGGTTINQVSANSEITLVAMAQERVIGVVGGVAVFANDPSAPTFFEVYYGAPKNANFLAGTGFNDGALIASGAITVINSSFTVIPTSPMVNYDAVLGRNALDNSGIDNYLGLDTIDGIGITALDAVGNVGTVDAAFFRDAPTALMFQLFNSTQVLPFVATDPSAAFVFASGGAAPVVAGAGLGVNFGPTGLGKVNGLLPIGGPNGGGPSIQFQARADNGFIVEPGIIPEPMTASLGLMGLAALGLVGLRRRSA